MSAPPVTLGLFLHSHQPVGNFDWVFEQNWNQAYRPMLEALDRHPGVRATLHYTGPLLEWFDEHKPEFRDMVARLLERGQVEIAGGGFYEPILAMLPEEDRQGQIDLMRREIEERWGVAATGAWLAERVWEPGLAATLARAGVEYTLVDDSHFASTGIPSGELSGYYLTEDQGETVAIVPGLKLLRNSIPWRPVTQVIRALRREAERRPGTFLVMGDDGEKFGAWPDTFAMCWTRSGGWVDRFFTALEQNQEWLATSTLGDWVRSQPAEGMVYLPTGSYHEMEEWSLPAGQIVGRRRFLSAAKEAGLGEPQLRAGFWRNFLVKYPEAAAMRHRIFRVRRLIDSLPSGPARREAERLLWKGENNCPYWHGIFGGVYLRNIRSITTGNLVAAESRAIAAAGATLPLLEKTDLDLDQQDEIVVRTEAQQLVLDPLEGGAITEWDIAGADWPLLTVIARRPEAYHSDLGEGESISPGASGIALGGRRKLSYDPCRRLALQEQLLSPGTQQAAWVGGRNTTQDLRLTEWRLLAVKKTRAALVVALARDEGETEVTKTVTVPRTSAGISVEYVLRNAGATPFEGTFVSEWNLGLPGPANEPSANRLEEVSGVTSGRIAGGGPIALSFETEGFDDRWEQSIETVSSSEAGLELSYQGLCVAFVSRVQLAAGDSVRLRLEWEIARI